LTGGKSVEPDDVGANRLRLVKQQTLMAIGLYNEPAGA
jgi:hypothetical protein